MADEERERGGGDDGTRETERGARAREGSTIPEVISPMERVREAISPSILLLPSTLSHSTPLSSRDLITEDSQAMRTEPICVRDGAKEGDKPCV